MRAYTKFIVEQQSAEHWTAWLADFPQLSVGGEWPAVAIKGLTFGADKLATNAISAIDDKTRG